MKSGNINDVNVCVTWYDIAALLAIKQNWENVPVILTLVIVPAYMAWITNACRIVRMHFI